MAKAIRVTVTSVYEYMPNLEENEYLDKGITTIAEALELDRRDCAAGKISADELSFNLPKTTAVWEIVEDPT